MTKKRRGDGPVDLTGRSLLRLNDLTDRELFYLLDLADELKNRKRGGVRGELLKNRNIALIFEKSSTRTRCAFVVAAGDEGGHAEFLDIHDIHIGRKESIADSARVLGRMFDGIAFRGYQQRTVDLLAKHAGVPVWNALTDDWHPTQILADLQTIREHFGAFKDLRIVYAGDGRNNVARTLMLGAAMTGMHFVCCAPETLMPPAALCTEATQIAAQHGGSVALQADPQAAAIGANVIYTDVWASMGEEAQFEQRLQLLRPYQVDMAMIKRTGNLSQGRVVFLHCLPAFHDRNTEVTKKLGPLEVTDDVYEAPFSKVFDEAENRVHTIKAIMVATLLGQEGS